uniref:Homeobox domain-containing protein n=1 Tax=Timema cristinae TaxID=61476 RepID=A0A7R9CBP8_TIMCR|nr:unnamed protein product [Timema cristinae]
MVSTARPVRLWPRGGEDWNPILPVYRKSGVLGHSTTDMADGTTVHHKPSKRKKEPAAPTPKVSPAGPGVGGDLSDGGGGSDSDRKRKKARTTFTGRQIFELEKQFEVKKYLSSSERAEMAKLLNVTETQNLYTKNQFYLILRMSRSRYIFIDSCSGFTELKITMLIFKLRNSNFAWFKKYSESIAQLMGRKEMRVAEVVMSGFRRAEVPGPTRGRFFSHSDAEWSLLW